MWKERNILYATELVRTEHNSIEYRFIYISPILICECKTEQNRKKHNFTELKKTTTQFFSSSHTPLILVFFHPRVAWKWWLNECYGYFWIVSIVCYYFVFNFHDVKGITKSCIFNFLSQHLQHFVPPTKIKSTRNV